MVSVGVLQPIKNFGKDVNDAFVQMKDPKAYLEKRIDNIPVVDESERDDYLFSLGELHNTTPGFQLFNTIAYYNGVPADPKNTQSRSTENNIPLTNITTQPASMDIRSSLSSTTTATTPQTPEKDKK